MKNNRFLALSELFFPQKGGHITWFHEICKRLNEVILITRTEDSYPKFESKDGLTIYRVFLQRVKWCIPESLFMYLNMFLNGLLKGKRADYIISARVIPEGFVGNLISFFRKKPTITIVHGEEINRLKSIKGKSVLNSSVVYFKKKIIWTTLKKTDLIICNSNFSKNLLLNGALDQSKIKVVHPGTDPERFYPADKDMSLVKSFGLFNKFVLLTTGRLTPRKGQDMVIMALPEIKKTIPNVAYLVVGNGEYLETLKALTVKFGVEDSVIFCNSVSDEMLPKMYNFCDLFLMPNRTLDTNDAEGFGIVFLEANSCGKPVIGGNSGGVPDAIVNGVTGVIISADLPENISKAVVDLYLSPEKMKWMGAAGRARVLDCFSWEYSVGELEKAIGMLSTKRDV